MVDLTGQQLGPYKVEGLIGRGGMAAVYKAYHENTSRNVAIKVMLPDIALDESFRARFEREAKTLAGLQHVHILPVFDYGRKDDFSYLVMPFLPGKTLADKINQQQLTLTETASIFRQLASALDYAHSKGILHRDLKPENVMLDEGGNVLLADFGLTKLLDESKVTSKLTSDSSVIGTPAYMSPEQGQGIDLDHRSDLYSLTVVLYEMLTGVIPFSAETPVAIIFKHVADPLPAPSIHRADLPVAVDAVVKKGMAKKPEDRFNSAADIADALDQAIEGVPAGEIPGVRVPRNDGEMSTTQVDKLAEAEARYNPAAVATPTNPSLDGETVVEGISSADIPAPKAKNTGRRVRPWAFAVALLAAVAVAGGVVFFALNGASDRPDFFVQAHDNEILALDISTEGDVLITGSADDEARVWSLETGEQIYKLEAHAGDVIAVGISPDGEEFYTSGNDSRSFTWYAETGTTKIQNIEGTPIFDITYASDSVLGALVVGQTLRVYFVADPEETERLYEEFAAVGAPGRFPIEAPNPSGSRYTAVAFAPQIVQIEGETEDGRPVQEYVLMTGDEAGNLVRWTLRREAPFETMDDLPEEIQEYVNYTTSFTDPEREPITEPLDPEIMNAGIEFITYSYLSLDPLDKQMDVANHNDQPIVALAIDDTGSEVVTVGEDGEVVVWDAATLEKLRIFENQGAGSLGEIHDVAFSPGSDLLALATQEIDVLILNIETGETVAELYTYGGDPLALDFTPAGGLVVGADDGRIYAWDLSGEIMEIQQPSD
ncbi:MAG: serine/threonine-protein kinase, partial [Chloroflexota bacterium]